MNENNPSDNKVETYKASANNLNTIISNPTVNINDTMDMNIKAMNSTTNNQLNIENQINNNTVTSTINPTITTENVQNTNHQEVVAPNNYVSTSNASNVNKTYVATNNKPKKKTVSITIGPEFKIAILIVVILLIFIFLLPIISDLLR